MSVYDELRITLEVTPDVVALVRRVARATVRMHNFPPLGGHDTWNTDAVEDLVQEFFAARPIEQRLTALIAAAPNEAAFIGGLETAVANFVRDELRKLPRGSVARTVQGVIDDEPRLTIRNDHVCLDEWAPDAQPAQCDQAHLIHATNKVDVSVPPWNPNSAHRAPFADRASIVRLVEVALAAAGAPVQFNVILDVVTAQCVIPELSTVSPTEDHSLPGEPVAEASEYAAARAAEIWAGMDATGRHAVSAVGGSVREAATHLGVGKTKAAQVLKEVREHLAEHLADDPAAADVARELLRLAADESAQAEADE